MFVAGGILLLNATNHSGAWYGFPSSSILVNGSVENRFYVELNSKFLGYGVNVNVLHHVIWFSLWKTLLNIAVFLGCCTITGLLSEVLIRRREAQRQ